MKKAKKSLLSRPYFVANYSIRCGIARRIKVEHREFKESTGRTGQCDPRSFSPAKHFADRNQQRQEKVFNGHATSYHKAGIAK